MRFSILIAAHDEGGLLARTVRSCIETTDGLDREIIVADDASADDSVDEVRRDFDGVRVVAHEQRRGVAATKDLAARHARGDVLVFLDGHCKPEPGAIGRLVEAVEDWDGRAVVTPCIPALDADRWENRPDQVGRRYNIHLELLGCWWSDSDGEPTRRSPAGREFHTQSGLIGCCLAVGREWYAHLRGFDVGMQSYGSEDVDFGLKCWLMGGELLHDPSATIGHRFRDRPATYATPQEHMLANQLRMARKCLGDDTWPSWIGRFAARLPVEAWEGAWREFRLGRESVEEERAYLLANRVRDEFDFALEFDQDWPLLLRDPGRRRRPSPSDPFRLGATIPPFTTPPPTVPGSTAPTAATGGRSYVVRSQLAPIARK